MIGIDCQWRMMWTKTAENEFQFVNEEHSGRVEGLYRRMAV